MPHPPLGRLAALAALALAPVAEACAYNASQTLSPITFQFEWTVENGPLVRSPNLAYYFVLDTKGEATDGPLVNGPAPLTFPFPDPRSYLPFIRDEAQVLDRETVAVPSTKWDMFFALYEEAGAFVLWQGKFNADGTVNERFRQMQDGREWAVGADNKSLRITLPLPVMFNKASVKQEELPTQWEANLAVALRGQGRLSRQFVVERWGRVPNATIPIPTKPGNQDVFDNVTGVTFPENLPAGTDAAACNFVKYTYRFFSE